MFNTSIIKNAGLSTIKKYEVMLNDSIIEADYVDQNSTISKYYIYPISLQTFEAICESETMYREFELRYIEPIFMDVDGDLSWNLYLAFVLSDEDYVSLSNEKRTIAESSKEYARKLVISESRFDRYIPVGKLENVDSNVVVADPLEEWYQALRKANLEFCLDKFSKRKVDSYLAGTHIEPPLQQVAVSNRYEAQMDLSEGSVIIKDLILGSNFRPHCFSPSTKFAFSNVNLLEGANGSGKTSILEAIELAFTGDIQRERMGNRNAHISEKVDCLTLNNGKSFNRHPDPAERKYRESQFYKNREKKIDKLNQAFHQYNYFSSEEVYKFCFGEQPDFNEAFSRVIFGEELSLVESDWSRYKEEFFSREKTIKADVDKIQAQIDLLSQSTESRNEHVSTSLELLTNLLIKLSLTYDRYDTNKLQSLLCWAKDIQSRLVELQNSTGFFDNLKEMALLNADDLDQRITELETKQEYFNQQKAVLSVASKKIERNSLTLSNKLKEISDRHKDILSQLNKIKYIEDTYNRYINLYSDRSKVDKREQLERLRYLLKTRLGVIDVLFKNWGTTIKQGLPSISEQQLLAQKIYCEKEISDIEDRLSVNKTKQNTAKSKKEFLENLISEIKALGAQYIQENPDTNKCPLCGADHKTSERLKEKIQVEMSSDKDDLTILLAEYSSLIKDLADIKGKLKGIINDLEIYRALNSAVKYIFDKQQELDITLIQDASISKSYDVLISVLDSRPEIESSLYQIDEQVVSLEAEGFTLANIQHANLFFASEEIKQLISDRTIFDVKFVIEQQLNSLNTTIIELDNTHYECQSEKSKDDMELGDLKKKLNLMSKDLQQVQVNLGQLRQWDSVLRKIIDTESKSLRIATFQDWSMYLTKAITENTQLQQRINEAIILQKNHQDLSNLNIKVSQLKDEKRRCKLALKMLEWLRPLAKYSEDFLNKNITVISDLFLTLHLPHEFDSLGISDKQLVAYRKGSNIQHSIHQMSAGQRTAVVLSVFFALHLSLPTAPNFILLDEPVANMDDLNVLGLLDFLRQLYLTRKTQIFFTTANPLVASLFRRKFSYLHSDFNAYRFRRIGDKSTRIITYIYKPDEEDGQQINIVS